MKIDTKPKGIIDFLSKQHIKPLHYNMFTFKTYQNILIFIPIILNFILILKLILLTMFIYYSYTYTSTYLYIIYVFLIF